MSVSSSSLPTNANAIHINETQRRNPLLQHIRNVPIEFVPGIVADFVMGSTCALYLSIRFHLLHPSYIIGRIQDVGLMYKVRLLVLHVDIEDNTKPLLELNKRCIDNNFVLLLAWSLTEAARYIETFKSYESKPPTSIQERVEVDHLSRCTAALTQIRSVNKPDVVTLFDTFGSFRNICNADEARLALCPGLGDKKVQRLHAVLHTPFKRSKES